jgi:hypothetical protein
MPKARTAVVIPLLIMALGVGWLLNVLRVMVTVDWVWTLGLAAVGILSLATTRLTRNSFVIGTFLITASVLSVLRQTNVINFDIEVPVLVIVFGGLLLLAHLLRLPLPAWAEQQQPQDATRLEQGPR